MRSDFAPGDWVTCYYSGFFRVERVIRRFYDESDEGGVLGTHQVGEEFEHPALVLKRGFNSKLRRSLGWCSCSAALCAHLPQHTTALILDILHRNMALRRAFDAYIIPPVTFLHNIGLHLETPADHRLVEQLITFVQPGRTFCQINARMNELGISSLQHFPHNSTLQLENSDFETTDKRLVFRDA